TEQLQIVNPTKEKFDTTIMNIAYHELIRIFSNELEKENSVLLVYGFSFKDEHILEITKRSIVNPTLQIYIFCYDDISAEEMMHHFQVAKNHNIFLVRMQNEEFQLNRLNDILQSIIEDKGIIVLNEFMKLGQVVEVRGQKIRARVFENKNGPILLYKGDIIKNVSVGSFIKIPKGFISIIGKIEGEHISELREQNAAQRFQKESDSIERMIDISVLGVMEHGVFMKGMVEIPLVFSDVYILEEYELQRVFSFFEDKQNAVALGNIAEYKDYKLYVDAQLLFGSHIGIFGNTGSGKSNTLATLYTALFQQYGDRKNFKKSKFLIFDFNGEYEDAFTENKQVYHLSTRCNNKDKICIPLSVLEDMEFWSVLCEISEKTQVPFLERVLKDYQQISHCSFSGKKYLARLLQERVKEVLLYCYRQGRMWEEIRENLTELLGIVLKDMVLLQEQYKNMRIHCQWNELSAKESFSDMEESTFAAQTIEPLMKLLSQENLKDGDGFGFFDFAMKYRFWSETLRRRTQVDFIEPMIKRFEARLPYIRRLFVPVVEV
ncbi:MAG: DUF87 domain-containing protein, partial [Epulopiscium sp.]|nr:DUF87 domain-containing protein [Candidatus Epulonipiscium sp.]